MVELPHGRMKSREGSVVDADDLMDEMFQTAKKTTEELGKTDDFNEEERRSLYNIIGSGALKYYILKVDPKKNMLFNPEESIDFNGNTGPFIQYTYARIQSLFRKSGYSADHFLQNYREEKVSLLPVERLLLRSLSEYPYVLRQAGETFSPALLANYCYELVKLYNHYYQDTPILKRIEEDTATFRILLSWIVGRVVKRSMQLLGIEVPEKM
jgi:arginyl-tRNA synthetase